MGNTCGQDTRQDTEGPPPGSSHAASHYDPKKRHDKTHCRIAKCESKELEKHKSLKVLDIQQKLERLKQGGIKLTKSVGGANTGPYEYIDIGFEGKKGIYEGTFDGEGLRYGEGTMVWEDKSMYSGQWISDKANGWGYLILNTGDHYYGYWQDDKAEGQGTYVHADESKYSGMWKEDKQDGQGLEIWPDLSSFEGQYKDGRKNGYGQFKWADGTEYKGTITDNRIEGEGEYKWQDGRQYNGEWLNNQMNGKGIFVWPDGKKYTGEFLNDKKHGEGNFKWPDYREYQGSWVNGQQLGRGKFYEGNGKTEYTGEWLSDGTVKWDGDKAPKNNAKNK